MVLPVGLTDSLPGLAYIPGMPAMGIFRISLIICHLKKLSVLRTECEAKGRAAAVFISRQFGRLQSCRFPTTAPFNRERYERFHPVEKALQTISKFISQARFVDREDRRSLGPSR